MHSCKSGCSYSFVQLYLPKNELYAPPLNFHVYDKIKFGLTPLVGSHSIKSIHNPDYHPDTQAHGRMFTRLVFTVVALDTLSSVCFALRILFVYYKWPHTPRYLAHRCREWSLEYFSHTHTN